MATEPMGIKETKELLEFVFKINQGIVLSIEDKKANWLDIPNFFPAIFASPAAFTGIRLVPKEWADLDDQEKIELMDFTRQWYQLPDQELEILIEDSIEQVIDLVRTAIKWANRTRKAQGLEALKTV